MDQFFRDRQGIDDDKKHTGGGIEPLCIPASSGFEVLTAHHEQLTDATTINKSHFYTNNAPFALAGGHIKEERSLKGEGCS